MNIFYNISVLSVLVPLILCLILFSQLEANSRLLFLLLAFASIAQLSAFLVNSGDKVIFYNLYIIVDAIFWGFLFYRNSHNKGIRLAIIIILMLQVSLYILRIASVGIQTRFFSEFVCLNSLLQLFFVLSLFYERYKREEIKALEKEPMFWFCLGILIYSPTSYFLFAFFDIVKNNPDYKQLWAIHHILNAGMYLIFSIGICTNLKRPSTIINVFRRHKS